jgi:hypothetical protein
MGQRRLTLSTLPGRLAVCRLEPGAEWPAWAASGSLISVTRTADELSVVCGEEAVPDGVRCERGWKGLRVRGPLAFSETGVLSSVVGPLAKAGIGVFVVSTYDTDYILVKAEHLSAAAAVLVAEGHAVGRRVEG